MTSAFAYIQPLSLLLREAKGRQQPAAMAAFEDLLFVRCAARLAGLKRAHGVREEDILLAPLRLQRAVRAEWHPSDLLLRASGAKGKMAWKWKWQTQSSTPALERRRRVQASVGDTLPVDAPKRRSILVIDDVLTSGETALKVLREARARPECRQAQFHLFTLLRAPAERDS